MKLQDYTSHLLPTIPHSPDAPEINFTKDLLPPPPKTLFTDALIIQHCYHDYSDSFRADGLHLSSDKPALYALGILILARLFHDEHAIITLQFNHPASGIRRLVLERPTGNQQGVFYTTTPKCFCYFVEKMFELSNAEHMVIVDGS